jgi:HEAT repeat protein
VRALFWSALFSSVIGLGSTSAAAFVWPSAPSKIARALESGDVAERRSAAIRLGDLPEKTADTLLVKALGDPDIDVRLHAAKSAVRLRSTTAVDVVIPWLNESDVRVRLAACELIRYVPTVRAVLALGRVLSDPDAGVRQLAASAMGASGAQEAVGPLLGHLDDPAASVRVEVAQALARVGDSRAAVPLIGKVGDSAPEVRRAVVRALGELGDQRAASALILALRDNVAAVRVEALTALGRLGSQEAVLAIAPLVEERALPEVRVAALASLGKIGSEAAVKTLIKNLASEDAAAKTSQVRDALEMSGANAVGSLLATLDQFGHANVAAGSALVLGSMKAPGAGPAIVRAMHKGSLAPYAGLRALALLGDPATLPTVLELLSDSNQAVRRQAVITVTSLLDPTRKDGRAVEPLVAALRDPRTSIEEREELLRALGRTGAPRAIDVLVPLAGSKNVVLRIAAIDALGEIGQGGQDAELLRALGDDNASVRLHAALALSLAGGEASVATLLERLTEAATEDRTAIGLALSGAASRGGDQVSAALARALSRAGGAARDALIEGLGRSRGANGGAALAELARKTQDSADRRKVAEALRGHPEQMPLLSALLGDVDPAVRAEAVWSAGFLPPDERAETALTRSVALATDADLGVATNAAASVARLAKTLAGKDPAVKTRATAALCGALGDFRSYVRVNALGGLGVLESRCDGGQVERRMLTQDSSEMVRRAAARLLRGPLGARPNKEDAQALARCLAEDKSGMVASACRAAPPLPGPPSPVVVFVVPDGRTSPAPLAPYSLELADGFIRSGMADRRGAIFESAAPGGELRLLVPGPLAR